ncbi:MAG: XylR N-terminal domain-containing protein, partial [Chloroflexi bacterium]|nr:XylR N-terminal domain-containing protein [Chloroflexota bacterium]
MDLTKALLSEERPGTLQFGGARIALMDIEASFWGLRRQMEGLVGPRLTEAVLQHAGANGGTSFARTFLSQSSDGDRVRAFRDVVAAYQAAGFGQFQVEALEWPIGRALIRGTDNIEAWMMRQHGRRPETPVCAYAAGVLVGFANSLGGRSDVVCIERACQAMGAESCLFELLPAEVAGGIPAVALTPDPGIGQELNLLEILFDRMPMGIVIFDRDICVRRCNPTWAGYVDRYTPSSASQVVPGTSFYDLAPGTEATVSPIFERVLGGEVVCLDVAPTAQRIGKTYQHTGSVGADRGLWP